jgi:hypothetical protein
MRSPAAKLSTWVSTTIWSAVARANSAPISLASKLSALMARRRLELMAKLAAVVRAGEA